MGKQRSVAAKGRIQELIRYFSAGKSTGFFFGGEQGRFLSGVERIAGRNH
jgi:hypothetical protein